jgi:hypothetical protein
LAKRTADEAVAQGHNITSVGDIVQLVSDRSLDIMMFEISLEETEEMDKCLLNLKTIKNTMRLPQVVWTSLSAGCLQLTELTCICCGNKRCEHFTLKLATWRVPVDIDRESTHHAGNGMHG